MANNILKDKLGNILNPIIPRYEKKKYFQLPARNIPTGETTITVTLPFSVKNNNYGVIATIQNHIPNFHAIFFAPTSKTTTSFVLKIWKASELSASNVIIGILITEQ